MTASWRMWLPEVGIVDLPLGPQSLLQRLSGSAKNMGCFWGRFLKEKHNTALCQETKVFVVHVLQHKKRNKTEGEGGKCFTNILRRWNRLSPSFALKTDTPPKTNGWNLKEYPLGKRRNIEPNYQRLGSSRKFSESVSFNHFKVMDLCSHRLFVVHVVVVSDPSFGKTFQSLLVKSTWPRPNMAMASWKFFFRMPGTSYSRRNLWNQKYMLMFWKEIHDKSNISPSDVRYISLEVGVLCCICCICCFPIYVVYVFLSVGDFPCICSWLVNLHPPSNASPPEIWV